MRDIPHNLEAVRRAICHVAAIIHENELSILREPEAIDVAVDEALGPVFMQGML